MKNNTLGGILNLKKLLESNKISFENAIKEFSSLLTSFQDDSRIDEEKFILKNTTSKISLKLLQEINELDYKITHLNRIVVLQELGIKFEDEEMKLILGQE